jgi:hypothetical protein
LLLQNKFLLEVLYHLSAWFELLPQGEVLIVLPAFLFAVELVVVIMREEGKGFLEGW